MDQARLIAGLRAERDELAERVRQLESIFIDRDWIPPAWRLTVTEAYLLNLLLVRQMVSDEQWSIVADTAEWSASQGGDQSLRDQITQLRRKLRSTPANIETDWGRGYRLDDTSRLYLSQLRLAHEQSRISLGAAHAR